MGTYGGGLAHLQAHTHKHTHRQIHNLPRLPDLFTSQSQMPQLSHQYHCVNDANCYAHWTIVQGLQYQNKYASVGAAIVWSGWLLLCENRCKAHPSLATCQEATRLLDWRSHLTCNLNFFSSPSTFLASSDKEYSPRSVTSSAFWNGASLQKLQCAHPPHSTLPVTHWTCTIGALPLVWVHCRCSAQPSSCPAVLGPISTWFIALKYHCTN